MRYDQGVTSVEKPAEYARGPDQISAASSSHVAARPRYRRQRSRSAADHEPKMNVRAYKQTATGAVTIASLQAMPSAHAPTAAAPHARRRPGSMAFAAAKIVSR